MDLVNEYVSIPRDIYLDPGLLLLEKMALSKIIELHNLDHCFVSNNGLAEFLQVSRQRASQVVVALQKKGYITKDIERNGNGVFKKRTITPIGVASTFATIASTVDRGSKQALRGSKHTIQVITKKNNQTEYTPEFLEFWKIYPRKDGKKAAFRKWKTVLKTAKSEDVINAAEAYAKNTKRTKTSEEFIKHGATFLGPDEWWKEWFAKERNKQEEAIRHEENQYKICPRCHSKYDWFEAECPTCLRKEFENDRLRENGDSSNQELPGSV